MPASDSAGALSYGQQKLLTLAMCLASDARVLILDEPVSGVHPDVAAKIVVMMRRLSRQNTTIIFIEHDIAAVRECADTVVVMDEGRLIAQGTPADVLERPEILEAYVA